MDNIIKSQYVTISRIAEIFDEAAIDAETPEVDEVYVTGHQFNFWVRVDEARGDLIYWTYWEFVPDVNEAEALKFANQLNGETMMVQFSYTLELQRLYGHYALPFCDGLMPKLALRIAQRISAIFDYAVKEGISNGLLEPIGCDGDDAEVETFPMTKH